jgi:hypothetical protein
MDPKSPYYNPPGTKGPASPDEAPTRQVVDVDVCAEAREAGRRFFRDEGFDVRGMLEWPVAWGDCDMFQ